MKNIGNRYGAMLFSSVPFGLLLLVVLFSIFFFFGILNGYRERDALRPPRKEYHFRVSSYGMAWHGMVWYTHVCLCAYIDECIVTIIISRIITSFAVDRLVSLI